MVAICENSGAYLYDCRESEMDNRIAKEINAPPWKNPGYIKGNVNYDGCGNMRNDLAGWLFCTPDLFRYLRKIGCETVYIKVYSGKKVSYRKYGKDMFPDLQEAYQMIQKKSDGKGADI